MSKLTYSERYTNVNKFDDFGSYTGIQIASKLNQKNGEDYKLIDAIDIDWNGAFMKITGTYLHNTEDLLDIIDNIGDLADLTWVKDKLDKFESDLDKIGSSYVSKSNLDTILGAYQHKLTPGDHISITADNVISAYGLLSEEKAAELYTKSEDFEAFSNYVTNNYYTKNETLNEAKKISYNAIVSYVIKNADHRFNDLEKVSDWILSQPSNIPGDISDLSDRLTALEQVVGYSYYDETLGAYSYSSLIETVYNLLFTVEDTSKQMNNFTEIVYNINNRATESYNLSYAAYSYAYFAYEFLKNDNSYAAYVMAYTAYITVGHRGWESYFTPLTEEEIAMLEENPDAFPVYSVRSDNHSGVPQRDKYNKDSGLQYYTYTEGEEATGLTKDVIYAVETAEGALYNLEAETKGSQYVTMKLTPDEYEEGNPVRTISLEITEADINDENGEIEQKGMVNTNSLQNAFSYIFTPDFISSEQF